MKKAIENEEVVAQLKELFAPDGGCFAELGLADRLHAHIMCSEQFLVVTDRRAAVPHLRLEYRA